MKKELAFVGLNGMEKLVMLLLEKCWVTHSLQLSCLTSLRTEISNINDSSSHFQHFSHYRMCNSVIPHCKMEHL